MRFFIKNINRHKSFCLLNCKILIPKTIRSNWYLDCNLETANIIRINSNWCRDPFFDQWRWAEGPWCWELGRSYAAALCNSRVSLSLTPTTCWCSFFTHAVIFQQVVFKKFCCRKDSVGVRSVYPMNLFADWNYPVSQVNYYTISNIFSACLSGFQPSICPVLCSYIYWQFNSIPFVHWWHSFQYNA